VTGSSGKLPYRQTSQAKVVLSTFQTSNIIHSVSKRMRLSEPAVEIWMKIDPYYQHEDVAQ